MAMRFLLHNLIVHPVAGLLWFVGAIRAGDAVHQIGAPNVAKPTPRRRKEGR